jgi:hypothetical protein
MWSLILGLRSAYHMLKEEDNNNQPEASSARGKES